MCTLSIYILKYLGQTVVAEEKQAATAATLAGISGAPAQRIKRNVRVNILNYRNI